VNKTDLSQLKIFLNEKYQQYNNKKFIIDDPVSIPHKYKYKEDIEIAGFLTSSISWGGRKSIIQNANKLMSLMGNSPFDFIMNANINNLNLINSFVHRTFNSTDCKFFILSLKNIYTKYAGLEEIFSFTKQNEKWNARTSISHFANIFFEIPHPEHTVKHIANPDKGSAAKKINMFLRWMVRKDLNGVDLGIWENIPISELICPLDVHSATTSRKLGLLQRKTNDWKAAVELTENLKKLDSDDPVKYDFALFGLGVFEKF